MAQASRNMQPAYKLIDNKLMCQTELVPIMISIVSFIFFAPNTLASAVMNSDLHSRSSNLGRDTDFFDQCFMWFSLIPPLKYQVNNTSHIAPFTPFPSHYLLSFHSLTTYILSFWQRYQICNKIIYPSQSILKHQQF